MLTVYCSLWDALRADCIGKTYNVYENASNISRITTPVKTPGVEIRSGFLSRIKISSLEIALEMWKWIGSVGIS